MTEPVRVQHGCVGVELPEVDYSREGLSGGSCSALSLGGRCCVVQDVVNDLEIGETLHLQLIRVQIGLDSLYIIIIRMLVTYSKR